MREGLRNLYSVIKSADAFIKFVFITGVSKFSKVNLFSGLNNIQDITLDERYATICGYTEAEVLEVFAERLGDVNIEELRRWYNGYNFLGERVYNPFDVLLYLDRKQFKNYWFETGSLSFLIDLIKEGQYNVVELENVLISEEDLSSFDVGSIGLETLLFQTGYLTIEEKIQRGAKEIFRLTYPNKEVKSSFTEILVKYLTENRNYIKTESELLGAVVNGEVERLKDIFYSFLPLYRTVGIGRIYYRIMRVIMLLSFIVILVRWDWR